MPKRKPKRTWRWVTRDYMPTLVYVWVDKEKPKKQHCAGWQITGSEFCVICYAEFHALFGVDIEPGTCVKMNFVGKIIE